MSEDRFEELGIPRRGFLKKTATAAFVAPVVVSFGLDGIAEANTGSFSNQTCANQTLSNQTCTNQTCANQTFSNQADPEINRAIDAVELALEDGEINNAGVAKSLLHKLANAEAYADGGDISDACGLLASVHSELVAQMNKHITPQAVSRISVWVTAAQESLNCFGCPV